MPNQEELSARIVQRCCAAIEANRALLTKLDQAVGDGDHGINMARGFRALGAAFDDYRHDPFPRLTYALGMALVMQVGGASGPLFGSMLMAFGRQADRLPRDAGQAAAMLRAGVAAVQQRGKSTVGAKTMLDVLVPVCDSLEQPDVTLADVRAAAARALEETRPMLASKGRSAFLGERSRGHLDPGANSVYLLVLATCDALEEES